GFQPGCPEYPKSTNAPAAAPRTTRRAGDARQAPRSPIPRSPCSPSCASIGISPSARARTEFDRPASRRRRGFSARYSNECARTASWYRGACSREDAPERLRVALLNSFARDVATVLHDLATTPPDVFHQAL